MLAIDIKGLKKYYGDVKAVDSIDLQVEEGEIYGILGPNGAGKTTTMEMVETLRRPDSGEISVLGIDALRDPAAIKKIIGVQLQTTVFFERLKVGETLDYFRTFYPRTMDLEALVELVELTDKSGAMVDDLSGGQHKRLSIALALINDPRVVFLDEPTTGLDPQARRHIWDIVGHLREKGKTVVITTHYIEEAESLCDRVAVMDQGRIIARGTPNDLIDQHVSDTVIYFRLSEPVDVKTVEGIAGVKAVSLEEGAFQVSTNAPQLTLEGIFDLARERGLATDDVSIKRATLEDVFLKITGRRLRE
jgi:ABC-2 type transport system ATP-binding protein